MLHAQVETRAGSFSLRADLSISPGRTLVLFGPSGSGKSLILRSIAGIHGPVRGRIELNGRTFLDSARGIEVPAQDRGLGYVPQSYALFPHLTVEENVGFGLRRLPAHVRAERVADLLSAFQLEEAARRHPRQLSGGQQQRVALARAIAIGPNALLLDEPFAALDAPLRRLLRRELQTLRHRFGFAVVLVTHDLADACALGDQMAVVENGRISQIGTPSDVLYHPAGPSVARLTGLRNVFPSRVRARSENGLRVETGRFSVETPPYPYQVGAAVDLYVRPDRVVLVRPEHEHDSRRPNLVRARIVDELHLGPVHTLYFRLLGGTDGISHDASQAPEEAGPPYDLEVDLAAHPYHALHVEERREWLLSLPPEALHLTAPQGLAAGAEAELTQLMGAAPDQ